MPTRSYLSGACDCATPKTSLSVRTDAAAIAKRTRLSSTACTQALTPTITRRGAYELRNSSERTCRLASGISVGEARPAAFASPHYVQFLLAQSLPRDSKAESGITAVLSV